MISRRQRVRMLGSALLAFSSIAACVGGMPEGDAKDATGAAASARREAPPAKGKNGPSEGEKAKPRVEQATAPRKRDEGRAGKPVKTPLLVSEIHCPHGVLEDPHRGFVRCLRLEEKGAKWLPPAPQTAPAPALAGAPPAAGPSAAPALTGPAAAAPAVVPASTGVEVAPSVVPAASASTAPPAASAPENPAPPNPPPPEPEAAAPSSFGPPLVEIKALAFENGDVPAAEKTLGKLSDALGKCVAKNGGLSRPSGAMKIQFLVRAKGRAEGVEVLSSQNVSTEALSCVRLLLKNRAIGRPSADPVGVTFVLGLKATPKP